MVRWIQAGVGSLLHFLVQAHDFEGSSGDVLVHHKHEGSRQHRLQQLGLQAFVQAENAVPPVVEETTDINGEPLLKKTSPPTGSCS